jgi:hypothetical protein
MPPALNVDRKRASNEGHFLSDEAETARSQIKLRKTMRAPEKRVIGPWHICFATATGLD